MNTSEGMRLTPRLIMGLTILALGTLWTLDNLDILESEHFTRFWPVVLIAIGGVQLVNRRTNRLGPILLMVAGAALLGATLDLYDLELGDLIPLGIALFGGKLVWDALARRTPKEAPQGDATVHAFAAMAGVHWQSNSREFCGGDVTAVMGGVEVDLRNAALKPGAEVAIDVLAIMGGIEIFVPQGWRILADVLPLMGAFEDNTRPGTEVGPTLIVRGTAIMGSIEVKH